MISEDSEYRSFTNENVTALLSAWEAIARTGFAAKDVTKLQVIQISCQKSVRAMISEDSEHRDFTNENVTALLSAREAIARTGFSQEGWISAARKQISCHSMVRGVILGVLEHQNSIKENWERIYFDM